MNSVNTYKQKVDEFKTVVLQMRSLHDEKRDRLDDLKDQRGAVLSAAEPKAQVLAVVDEEIDQATAKLDEQIQRYIYAKAMHRSKADLSDNAHDQIPPRFGEYFMPRGDFDRDYLVALIGDAFKGRVRAVAGEMAWPGGFADGLDSAARSKKLAELDKQIEEAEAELSAIRAEIESVGGRFRD